MDSLKTKREIKYGSSSTFPLSHQIKWLVSKFTLV